MTLAVLNDIQRGDPGLTVLAGRRQIMLCFDTWSLFVEKPFTDGLFHLKKRLLSFMEVRFG